MADKLLADDRFAALWNNPDFQVDRRSDDWARLHPSQAVPSTRAPLSAVLWLGWLTSPYVYVCAMVDVDTEPASAACGC